MILFVNACTRSNSRTKRIADKLLNTLSAGDVSVINEVKLYDVDFPKTDEDFLKWRDKCIAVKDFSDKYFELAMQFAEADEIVIAAPYWDLSFPAVLKQYIEHINVLGITFEYTPEGFPKGLCKASKLHYVMTAGGGYVPLEFGYEYIKALAQNFYGIEEVELIKVVGLDIVDADEDEILGDLV